MNLKITSWITISKQLFTDAIFLKLALFVECQLFSFYNDVNRQQWLVFNNTKITRCPFCNTQYNTSIPVLDFFYEFKPGVWKPENQRLVLYNNSTLHKWHVDRNIIRNERLTDSDKKRVGYFIFHNNQWLFVNESLHSLKDLTNDIEVPIGKTVELIDGNKLLLSKDPGGRVVTITITNK